MTKTRSIARLVTATTLVLAVAVAVPALAELDRVPAGLDLWQTLGSGATAYSFDNDPLPAGFFCAGSAPFTGWLKFEGVPLQASGPLGTTDTIIERLDDAVFDARGVARTRIRARAISLVANAPVRTNCGTWAATVKLGGEQPVTTMVMHRNSPWGGNFQADLKLNVELTFTRLRDDVTRTVSRIVSMPTYEATPYVCPQYLPRANISLNRVIEGRRTIQHVTLDGQALYTAVAQPSNQCIVGWGCNPQGVCLPIYSWHDPAPPDKEFHFTHTPCELGYEQFCEQEDPTGVTAAFRTQLKELRRLGFIDKSPAAVLRSQRHPAGMGMLRNFE